MNLISLSTAEPECSIAFIVDGQLIYEEFWLDRTTHSKRLLTMIDHVLQHWVKKTLAEFDGFVAAKGPGSFTGLRIGISTAHGIALASGRRAYGVSSLDGLAYRFSYATDRVCAMMDAKRGQVYCAVYRFKNGQQASKSEEHVCSPEKAVALAGPDALFAGSGVVAYRSVISDTARNPVFSDPFDNAISAAALIKSLLDTDDPLDEQRQQLSPVYLRQSDAEMQFVEKC